MFNINDKEFANKGYYINLSTSIDRRLNIENLIEKYRIDGLERFEALTDEMIQYSCTKSHLGVFKDALDNDLDIIFVAEDDISINDICYAPYNENNVLFKDAIVNVWEDLKNLEWDVLLFGCNPKTHLIPITNNLAINHNSTGAWAYIIKKKAYKYILENLNYKKDLIAIDDFLPLLNSKGFITLCTIPLTINHAIGFESTLQPRGPVNYDAWIQGNYHKFLYDFYKNDFTKKRVEKEVTIVIAGHFVKNYLFYLNYLLYSLPDDVLKCKFLIHYDENIEFDTNTELINLNAYFRDVKSNLNVTLTTGFGGLISTIESVINRITTPYFIFLEHDWVFLNKTDISFIDLVIAFNNYNFINAVWFSKDDNVMRGFEISKDVNNETTPFEREERVSNVDLITTCRFSNNPVMFRTSKMKEWYYNIIKNEYTGIVHQSQQNVEEKFIPYYRDVISKNKWTDIKDNWGTYLYGKINEGPYVGHTDASRRYQGQAKSQPEINGEEYIKKNQLYINKL